MALACGVRGFGSLVPAAALAAAGGLDDLQNFTFFDRFITSSRTSMVFE
jgi:hypothetical protein